MIITSSIELEVGKIYNENNSSIPFKYLNKIIEHYAVLILKKSTKDEFLKYISENHPRILYKIRVGRFFYEVSTD